MFKLDFLKPAHGLIKSEQQKTSFLSFVSGFLLAISISYLIYIPSKKTSIDYQLRPGDIVKKDIIVNQDLTLEDKESTEKNVMLALEGIIPIYEYYEENQAKSLKTIREWLAAVKLYQKDYLTKSLEISDIKNNLEKTFGIPLSDKDVIIIAKSPVYNKIEYEELYQFIKQIYQKRIITSKIGAEKSKNGSIKIQSASAESLITDINDIYDKKDVRTELMNYLNRITSFSTTELNVFADNLLEFIYENISYSENLTNIERNRIRSQINPVLLKLKKGKIIIRQGDEASENDLKIINLISRNEEIMGKRLSYFFLIFFIIGILFIFLSRFFKIWKSSGINKDKLFFVTGVTLFASALFYRISLFLYPLVLKNISIDIQIDANIFMYALPFGFGALTMAFIFDLQSAVVFSFLNAIISGIICNWDIKIAIYVLLGNLAASYGIEQYQRLKRSPIFKSALLWLLPLNCIYLTLLNYTESYIYTKILATIIMGIFCALISLILVNFIIPIWEVVFNLLTDLKLIETANLNLPIFREMLEKAPGTYHHSQMVASLAESAALDLGLSPLLLTTMAYYHDIGKIEHPQFFTENQTIYKNPHENISPKESAKYIINHISSGLELAAKIKLPKLIASAIRQHHGNKRVKYFYDKAVELSPSTAEEFQDKYFRYPGEKPQSIENAIIMLADQVEAASKSLAAPSEDEIKNILQKIIYTNIEENQFDECEGLTLKALHIIANSFHKKLSSIYHHRISYPGFDFTKPTTDSHA